MKYRPEIDGLRAFAVLPVIFFHAGITVFSGGFVGVDIFFVISGYLITTILLNEMEQQQFSLVNFYERRVRRIIPSLFFVMLVTTVVAYFLLPPNRMLDYTQSLMAIVVFSSNILFWQESGYWGAVNELKPMLHTWTLAIEEQYYLLFPLFLMLTWRLRAKRIFALLMIISTVSFALAVLFSTSKPVLNFFLLPTRGWELAVGSIAAFILVYQGNVVRGPLFNRPIREGLSLAGLLLILIAVFVFDEETPFPSQYTLVPTLGTLLIIIFTTSETLVAKVLQWRLFVGVGLISYSAYLWHQPVFALAREVSKSKPDTSTFLALSLLSLCLAALSWKFIEAPFRNKQKFQRKTVFKLTLLGSLFFLVLGGFSEITQGMAFRFEKGLVLPVKQAQQISFGDDLCEAQLHDHASRLRYCQLNKGEKKQVLLYGDSHADALMLSAKEAFRNNGIELLYVSLSACPPIYGVYRADHSNSSYCYQHNNRVFDFVENNDQIEFVILTARWTLGLEGKRFDNGEGGIEPGGSVHLDIVKDGHFMMHEELQRKEEVKKAYVEAVQRLLNSGKKVVLIYPVPEAGWDVPVYLFKYYRFKENTVFDLPVGSTSYDVYRQRNQATINTLDSISHPNLFRVYPEKVLCNQQLLGRCITHNGVEIYYRDDDHLSDAGAKLVIHEIMQLIK